MARADFSPYALVIPTGERMNVPDYFSALRAANLVPSRYLDAKHAGVISMERDAETGIVMVSAVATPPEGDN